MKNLKRHLLILLTLVFIQEGFSQVPRVWVKAPAIQPGIINVPIGGTPPHTRAFFELDSRKLSGNLQAIGTRPALMRVSHLYDLGNSVTNPPQRDVLMIMTPRGYVGLGTERPSSLLDLNLKENSSKQLLTFSYEDGNKKWDYSSFGIDRSTTYWVNNAQLRNNNKWFIDQGSFNASASKIEHGWDGIYFKYYNHDNNTQGAPTHQWRRFNGDWKQAMQVTNSGNVRIGEKSVSNGQHKDYKLSVDGKIVSKHIVITDGSEWADYVFEKEYSLMPLEELKDFVNTNKHLPNIPTAKQVKEKGLNVYEMNVKMMEKIEELTLYIIQLKEENNKVKSRLDVLEEKNKK